MEFCTACGARIDKSHNYCGQCGAPLGTVNNNETDVQETTSGSSSKETGEGQQKGTDWAWSPEATPKFKKTMWETYKPRLKVAGYVLLALFSFRFIGALVNNSAPFESPDGEVSYSRQTVCKAGIAAVMGRPFANMRVTSENDNRVFINYTRESDGSRWFTGCEFQWGNEFQWFSVNNGEVGRLRTEEPISAEVTNEGLLIIEVSYSDGTSTTKRYIP